jgi:hypothetical protein
MTCKITSSIPYSDFCLYAHQIVHAGKVQRMPHRKSARQMLCYMPCICTTSPRARTRRDPSSFISLHQGHSRTLRPVHTFLRDMTNRHIPRPSHATPT